MPVTNNDIVTYTSRMKDYYISLYYQDAKILTSLFGKRPKLLPQSHLLSMELRELRAEQQSLNKILRTVAFDRLKELRDIQYKQNQALWAKHGGKS